MSSPMTGGNWEAVGVQPDIRVPQEDALRTAHAAAVAAILFGEAGNPLTPRYRAELETLRSQLAETTL